MPTAEELESQRAEKLPYAPLVSIVVPTYETPEKYLKELMDTVIVTGGLSDNPFFAKLLSEKLHREVLPMENGRYAGAYGAAILAREKLGR